MFKQAARNQRSAQSERRSPPPPRSSPIRVSNDPFFQNNGDPSVPALTPAQIAAMVAKTDSAPAAGSPARNVQLQQPDDGSKEAVTYEIVGTKLDDGSEAAFTPTNNAPATRHQSIVDLSRPVFHKDFHRYTIGFMSWYHNKPYARNQKFPPETFLDVTPRHISRWMYLSSFGVEEPGPEDRPIVWRAHTLEQAKKGLSKYMPDQAPPYNWRSKTGNPTKSKEVNQVIKDVRKFEVRKQGKPSRACRPFTISEFRLLIDMCRGFRPCKYSRFMHSCMMKHQFAMIARADDTCNFKLRDLVSHDRFDFALSQKVRWSKNVMEERDCPDQILMGSQDHEFCVLKALAGHLETYMTYGHGYTAKFMYSPDLDDDAPSRRNACYQRRMNVLCGSEMFQEIARLTPGNTASHAIRKFAVTFAKQAGSCTLDETDVRGRWKRTSGRVSDRYMSVEQPYFDAKVCKALCVGGPIMYKVKERSAITDEWIFEHVVPMVYRFYGTHSNVPKVLGRALLWACMCKDVKKATIYAPIRNRVVAAYREHQANCDACTLGVDENPVEKVRLVFAPNLPVDFFDVPTATRGAHETRLVGIRHALTASMREQLTRPLDANYHYDSDTVDIDFLSDTMCRVVNFGMFVCPLHVLAPLVAYQFLTCISLPETSPCF